MATDASSGSGRRFPATAGDSGTAYASRLPQGSARNLTQELAQLLAASIAQNQANPAATPGMPTNAELTSLASLVSAASGQRTFAPVFKDGLSALSYAKPQLRHTLSDPVEPDLPADDEPMPIPSTWREPAPSDDQRWYRQQMGAAFLGLIAGLMIVVPSVLWLSGSLGTQKPGAASAGNLESSNAIKVAEIKTVKVQVRPVEGSVESATQYMAGRVGVHPTDPSAEQAVPTAQSGARLAEARRVEEVLAQADRRRVSGDITGAREILEAAEGGAQGPVTFALAETFDPNMLAAWGSRGVASDAERAKALYRKALQLGIARAHTRLDALQ